MLKGALIGKEVQHPKGKKRKIDVEKNHGKELLSLKNIEKTHKNPEIDKATRLENVMVSEANGDTLNINSLPDEVILEIFSYLKQNQLGQIARMISNGKRDGQLRTIFSDLSDGPDNTVCRRWNMLTWIPLLCKKVNVQISPSHRSPTTVTKHLINRLPSCLTSIRLDLAYSDGKLDFGGLCVILQEKCPQLEILTLTRCKFSCSLSSVIDLCTHFLQNVKKLVFCRCEFSNCRSIDEWGGISKIEILDVFSCVSDSGDPLNKLSFSRMPYLKRLQLSCTLNIEDSFFEDDTTFLNQLCVLNLGYTFISPRIFYAIRNHGLNLKELCLCLVSLQDHDLDFNDSVFPELVTICLRDCSDVTCEGVVSVIQSCQSLQNVYVRKHVAESFEAHPFAIANRSKSGIVKAIACSHSEELDTYLSNCTFK